ncbi:DUF4070 domain-containing protein [Desulfococcaceae bacterium HSG9]|nr:DUF4070 domain-containing protein [Desulfococcaceae bacterium HSG9]
MKSQKVKRYGKGTNYKTIYLIAPRHPENFWSMQGTVDILGAKTLMPNSALATLMALTPDDVNIAYILCDENISEIDFDLKCDLAVITGATLHVRRINKLCKIFREKGRTVALGGTYATIEADNCRDIADYHFIGEAEYTWPQFLRQWVCDKAVKVYEQAEYIDLKDSPAPDWSLIDVHDYINISVQTSRGCPNRCDFCDVIRYVGRQYRIKTADQIMGEVQNAHNIGARTVFFSDDNFLGNKAFTKELLPRLIKWNLEQTRPLSFSTQITVQVADDEKLLKMLADARFSVLFLGVETVREASLKEVHKTQNLKYDIYARIERISRFGIIPFIGLIVGFDNDDVSVFDDLYHFIKATHSPIAGISLLNAPKFTPLYERLKKEGRLAEDDFSGEWQLYTNIIPKQMKRDELIEHYRNLFKKLYEPELFEARLEQWLNNVEYRNTDYTNKKFDPKQLLFGYRIFKHFTLKENSQVRHLCFRAMKKTWQTNPELMRRFFTLITQYSHFYHFLNEQRTDR